MVAVDGEFSFSTAIRVDKEKMMDLQEILSTYYTEIKYSAQLICNKTVHFDDLEDLLNYNNYEPKRIISIEITGKNSEDLELTLSIKPKSSYPFSFSRTISTTYSVLDMDKADTLEKNLDEWCTRCRSQYYKIAKYNTSWLYHKINDGFAIMFVTFFLLVMISAAILGETLPPTNFNVFWSLIALIPMLGFLWLLHVIDRKWILSLFPPIIFYWGDEVGRQDGLENFRKNILWVLVMGIVVSVTGAFIYAGLTNGG